MDDIRFVGDPAKEAANRRKPRVSFEEAKTVFYDENAIQYFDPDHSETEDRFLMLGMSLRLRVLVVCHCYREVENEIRIISAWRATTMEQGTYFGQRR
jgi:uncharacterized protein